MRIKFSFVSKYVKAYFSKIYKKHNIIDIDLVSANKEIVYVELY
jgi:hypothetical protein